MLIRVSYDFGGAGRSVDYTRLEDANACVRELIRDGALRVTLIVVR